MSDILTEVNRASRSVRDSAEFVEWCRVCNKATDKTMAWLAEKRAAGDDLLLLLSVGINTIGLLEFQIAAKEISLIEELIDLERLIELGLRTLEITQAIGFERAPLVPQHGVLGAEAGGDGAEPIRQIFEGAYPGQAPS